MTRPATRKPSPKILALPGRTALAARVVGLLAALAVAGAAPLLANEPLAIRSVAVGEQRLNAGEKQILQVTIKNSAANKLPVGLKVELKDERGQLAMSPLKRLVTLEGGADGRYFFHLKTPPYSGRYWVYVDLYTTDFKVKLQPYDPAVQVEFLLVGGKPRPGGKQEDTRYIQSFTAPKGLAFEKPDLVWENFSIQPEHMLLKETGKIRVDLRNVGGDIAQNSLVRLEYYNTRILNQIYNLAETEVPVLAPGERVELEFDFTFPDNTLFGEYQVVLKGDVGNRVAESDEANNIQKPQPVIRLNPIRLVFPEPDYNFEETGLFLFRWETRIYDQFKVQVGVDPEFQNAEEYFNIPQGDKWAEEQEVAPLEGELPGMARGLMEKANVNKIYWRVVGQNSKNGKTGNSLVQSFTIQQNETPAADGKAGPKSAGEGSKAPAAGSKAPGPQEKSSAPSKPVAPPAELAPGQ